jgi:uncharacterized Zn finger protein (UPF0148 family)
MNEKTCIECGTTNKLRWYKGPTCCSCYNRTRWLDPIRKEKRSQLNKKIARRTAPRYRILLKEAKRRGHEAPITLAEFEGIIARPCHYCGNLLGHPVITGGGIDRKDSALGYTAANCVSSCYPCNTIKSEHLSEDEMLAVAKLLIKMRNL